MARDEAAAGRLGWVFTGQDGLRPGWGCLLFVALLLAVGELAQLLVKLAAAHSGAGRPRGPMAPGMLIASELVSALVVLGVTGLMAWVERRRLAAYGLGSRAAFARLGGGALAGFAAISALVGILWAAHGLVLRVPLLGTGAALGYGLAWAVGFGLVACFEELLLRGYLLWTLTRGIGFLWASLALSAGFGLIHGSNPGETPVGLFSAAAVGALFCLSVWYTGSLWWAFGFHAAWDWGESFFWGTSDSGVVVQGSLFQAQPKGAALLSGGATGPEGSLLIFPLLLACALLMFLWWRRRPAAAASTLAAGSEKSASG